MKSARQISFEILLKIEKEKAYSNLTIDSVLSSSNLSHRDRAFVSAVIYGCTERKITIDYQIGRYLSKPLNKLKKNLLTILRLGVHQILFMDKVPLRAAVNESVKLAKDNNCEYAASLVNAVLRKIGENGLVLPDKNERTKYMSIKYSCPESLISMWKKAYGEEDTENLLISSLNRAPVTVRVNTLKTDSDTLIEIFKNEGVEAKKSEKLENAIIIEKLGSGVETLDSFKTGLFHIQDLASQYCALALDAKENETVFDLCSAPGGKAFTVSQMMNNSGKIFAFDVYSSRTQLIEDGAKRLSISNISAQIGDASAHNEEIGKADRVLCDVPCSGLGVIRRKPEIKYKELDEFKPLPPLQYKILCNAASYVKDGGRLVYSTCTLNKKENDKICDLFLEENFNFKNITPLEIPTYGDKYYTLMPHRNGSDGFFIAVFEKVGR